MGFERATILGVGLIGASVALALRENALAKEIRGFGRTEANLKKAVDRNIIDSYSLDIGEACDGSDLIVLATPPAQFVDLIRRASPSIQKGTIIFDVGSIKAGIVTALEEETPEGSFFIGTHPIAGSDRSGIETASADLFAQALCFITPTARSDKDALGTVTGLWKSIGATVHTVSPEEHDIIFSSVSHMPHVVAYALVNTVIDIDPSFIEYAGKGFRDTTRIAMSSPDLWADICVHNSKAVTQHLDLLVRNIQTIREALAKGDHGSLIEHFRRAKEARDRIE